MSDLPNLYLRDDISAPRKEQTVLLKQQRSNHRREFIEANEIEPVPREIDFLSKVSAKKGGKNISFQTTAIDSANKKTESVSKPAPKTAKQTGTKKADKKKDTHETRDRSKNAEETGKLQNKVEQQTGASNQEAYTSHAIEVVATGIEDGEARIQEIGPGSENVGDPKILADDQKGTKKLLSDGSHTRDGGVMNTGDKLGNDAMEAPVSTLSMASPSLPQVTPQSSGFGLPLDEVRSGAVQPTAEVVSDTERSTAGSPSLAIYRMISMRETRESCDLSPKSSYVILPTLTSSEGALINTRMAQLLNNDHTKTRGLELSSRDHLPALSPTPSNEEHVAGVVTGDHKHEPVRLPSVPSVESCPSRSPTAVRSLSRSSQVALPHIGTSAKFTENEINQSNL